MGLRDLLRFTSSAIIAHRLRSFLTMLGIVIGIASVILLTSIGEGARHYILAEFTQFGTNILQITPGKHKTTGPAGVFGGTRNPLTLEDAVALQRVPGVESVIPLSMGTARVETTDRARDVFVYGVTDAVPEVWKLRVRQGQFLPGGDPRSAGAVCVLGTKLKHEIFGDRNPLGEHVRIAGERFTVIGVMAPKGFMLGFDMDDIAFIPVSRAMPLFNRDDLMEIDVLFSNSSAGATVSRAIHDLMKARHRGEEDFTVVTQTEMLDTLASILGVVNWAVIGIGAISLLVGAIGILTMMWISVHERTREIGLSKALGATQGQILAIYLGESILLSTIGGVLGLVAGLGLAGALHLAIPALPLSVPLTYVALALGISFLVGVLSGVLPARRAAALDPIEALATE